MTSLFKQKINSIIPISEFEMDTILSAFNYVEIKKGDTLIKENTICNQYYFLEKGLLRFVYHSKEKEDTSWVIFEGVFFTEIVSLKSKKPTHMSLTAMEPSFVFSIEESKLNALCEKITSFEKYLRLTWEESLYQLVQMKLLQQFNGAKERYQLISEDNRFIQRIPQKHLASILGITPYSLSRLRSPKKK